MLFAAAAIVAAEGARAEPPLRTEAEKAQRIADLLQRTGLKPASAAAQVPRLCGQLLELLAAGNTEVQFVEPVARTEDADHPELRNYRRCTSRLQAATEYPFRVYRFNPDDNPASPVEEYVYEQWGGYHSRDSERCSVRDAVPVARGSDSYDGVIRFRTGIFIFALDISASRPGYAFQLWQFDAKERAFQEACSVNTRPPSKRPRRDLFGPHHY